jgi:hypothetical protein
MHILGREYNIMDRYSPVDGEYWVIPSYSPFGLRGIIVITLILKYGIGTQHTDPRGKATRDKKHPMILFR